MYIEKHISETTYPTTKCLLNNIFIITHGRVLFHATKSNLAPSNVKCTCNDYTNSFELRHLTNSKIDWNKNPIYISNDTYNTWSTSYNAYRLNTNSLNSSISNSQSSHQSSQ